MPDEIKFLESIFFNLEESTKEEVVLSLQQTNSRKMRYYKLISNKINDLDEVPF